jgi:hypothetical protein
MQSIPECVEVATKVATFLTCDRQVRGPELIFIAERAAINGEYTRAFSVSSLVQAPGDDPLHSAVRVF